MQNSHRILLLITMLVLLFTFPLLKSFYQGEWERYQMAEQITLSCFEAILSTGQIIPEVFLPCEEALQKLNPNYKVRITVLFREEGKDNQVHWYSAPHEEILQKLEKEGIYYCNKNCAIYVQCNVKRSAWNFLCGTHEVISYGGRIF